MKFKLISTADARVMSDYHINNSVHLKAWEPTREVNYHEIASWDKRLAEREAEQAEGRSAYFISYSYEGSDVIAICSLTNIVRGPFQTSLLNPQTRLMDIQNQKVK